MVLISTNKFPKITKLHESIGPVQCVVFDKIYMCAYLHQTALEIMSLLVSLVNDLHMKNSPQKVEKNEILATRAI